MICELFQCNLEKECKEHGVKCAKEQEEAVDRLLAYDINNEHCYCKYQSQDDRKSGYDIKITDKICK